MTYSVFNRRVRDLMASDDMPIDDARLTVKEDMLSDKIGEEILKRDPGYLQWAAMMDRMDRKFHEEAL